MNPVQDVPSVGVIRPRKASCWREARERGRLASSWAGVFECGGDFVQSALCVCANRHEAEQPFNHESFGGPRPWYLCSRSRSTGQSDSSNPPAQMAQELGAWCRVVVQVVTSRPTETASSGGEPRCDSLRTHIQRRDVSTLGCGVWTVISVCLVKGSYSFSASPPRTLPCADTRMLTSASNISFIHSVMAVIIHSSCLELCREKGDAVVLSRFTVWAAPCPGQAVGELGGL